MKDSAGRKDTLTTMLGSNTLWGRDALLTVDSSLLRIPLLLEVLRDFAGDRKELRWRRPFRGFWLRITQLYPVKEITL